MKVWVVSTSQGTDDFGIPSFRPAAVYAIEERARRAAAETGAGPDGEPASIDEFEVEYGI